MGLRLTFLTVDGFDTRAQDEAVLETDSSRQNIWEFPLGLRIGTHFKTASGWTVSSEGDLAYVPVTGDKNARFDVAMPGWSSVDSITRPVMDSSSVSVSLGLSMEKKNTTFSLNYAVDTSSHQTWQGFSASFGWRF